MHTHSYCCLDYAQVSLSLSFYAYIYILIFNKFIPSFFSDLIRQGRKNDPFLFMGFFFLVQSWLSISPVNQMLTIFWLLLKGLNEKWCWCVADLWCHQVQAAPYEEKTERWIGQQEYSSGVYMPQLWEKVSLTADFSF